MSVRKRTRETPATVEFDEIGLSVKDIRTRQAILRCDSTGDLYRVTPGSSPRPAPSFAAVAAVELWHERLGHPGAEALRRALRHTPFTCSPSSRHSCRACRLGKHARLPFSDSSHRSYFPF